MGRGPHGSRAADGAALVAEGRKRQGEQAMKGLGHIVRTLRKAGQTPRVAALLVNRAGWVTDALAYSLAWPEHVPVAEGLAVRDALRFAIGRLGVELVEVDEKSLRERASEELRLESADIEIRLKCLGTGVGRPWRKEQKLACLAAWVAVAKLR
jgi:hypothetical protein